MPLLPVFVPDLKGDLNMKTILKQLLCLCLSLILILGLAACSGTAGSKKAERLALSARPDSPGEIPDGLDIDWNKRYTFAELESQLSKLAGQYPDITELYSIGTSWQERDFQHGGDALREKGYPIHSLAVIEEATPDHITFREDDPV